jgi:3'-5' exoribonuclease
MKLSDAWPEAATGAGADAAAEKTFVADLVDGQTVTSYFVCPDRDVRTTKNGGTMVNLTLLDATGQVKGVHFDPSDEVLDTLAPGTVVKIRGRYRIDPKWGAQLVVDRLKVLEEGEYDPATLIPVSPVGVDELRTRLTALVAGVLEPHIRAMLERAFDPGREPGRTFAVGPAAVKNHHAYRHGLLEHSVVVGEVAAAVADRLPTVGRDLVVAGALLHDVGKVVSYSSDPFAPGFTDAGRLQGEIVLGHDIVQGLITEIDGFPAELSSRLRHIIVSHHGEKEKGSPVVPMTREAIVVHFCDDMTARVAAADDAERAAAAGDRWSSFSRMLEAFVYLGDERATGPGPGLDGGARSGHEAGDDVPAAPAGTPAAAMDTAATPEGAPSATHSAPEDAPDEGRLPFDGQA